MSTNKKVITLLTTMLFVCVNTKANQCTNSLGIIAEEREMSELKKKALSIAPAFKNYFSQIRKELKERDYVVELAEVALLAKEHLLLVGPPGNAKSMLADRILGNIRQTDNSPSYFRIQMTPETTISETHGPLDYKKLTETSRYERIYEEGMLLSRNVFIDEIFDARGNAIRNTLGLLNERAHAQGPNIKPGKIETAIAATNKYASEVYEKAGDDGPKAVFDRFAFSVFVPGEIEFTSNVMDLIQNAKKETSKLPDFQFSELDMARDLVSQVKIPKDVAKFLILLSTKVKSDTEDAEASDASKYYERLRNNEKADPYYRATKYHSPRTVQKAAGILKAIVVRDWLMKNGDRKLEATINDIKQLEKFFTLNGPSTEFLEHMIGKASPKERVQMETILQEREIFSRHFNEAEEDISNTEKQYRLDEVPNQLSTLHSQNEKDSFTLQLAEDLLEIRSKIDTSGKVAALSGVQIGLERAEVVLSNTLERITGENIDVTLSKAAEIIKVKELKKAQARLAEIERLEKELEPQLDQQQAKLIEEQKHKAELENQKQADKDPQVVYQRKLQESIKKYDAIREMRLKTRPANSRFPLIHQPTGKRYYLRGGVHTVFDVYEDE